VSRAKTGGIKGGLGLAEDKAEASIACRQTGPISFPKPLRQQDEMFSERISLVFKKLRVVRMVDRQAQHAGLPDLLRPRHRGLAAEQRDGGAGCGSWTSTAFWWRARSSPWARWVTALAAGAC
jgi:hypothetical protein